MDEQQSGVVYIVSGAFHVAAATQSAKSVRETNPWLAIDIFADAPVEDGVFDRVVTFEHGHLRSKVDHLPESRFVRSLYLDSDTRVVADLAPMFRLLERFDIALAHGHKRNGARQTIFWREEIPEAFPQINGGVILYRGTPVVRQFLSDWRDAYYSAGFKWDQVTLRELMWKSDLRLYILPPEYNIRYTKYLKVWSADEAAPKILHLAEFYDETANIPGVARRRDRPWTEGVKRLVRLSRRLSGKE
jgi:hypothetical protein